MVNSPVGLGDSVGLDKDQVKQMISNRLRDGKEFWKPLHARQDYWYLMYMMQDVIQQMKPVGRRRFISNEPHTAVDLAVSILTRNDAFWRIPLFETADENKDEQRFIGHIERALQGFVYDIDDQFSQRLLMRFWKRCAQSALLRGYIWGKAHITTDALKYRATPLVAEVYDPRLVYPNVDGMGLNYVIIETRTNLGELVNMYPDVFGERENEKTYNPNRTAIKVEYWSNDRGKRKGITGLLAAEAPVEGTWPNDLLLSGNSGDGVASEWVIPPYEHGYTPEQLPVFGVPVNGLNMTAKPMLGELLTDRLAERAELTGMPTAISWWHGQNAYIADSGRSILAAVEEHVPQYNELVATIMQHMAITAYGTWAFTSPTGQQPRFTPGIESKIALTPDERLERIEAGPMNGEAMNLIKILGDEKEKGMLANILSASGTTPNTGVLFQQMANAALNALEPYSDGMEEFGQRMGTSILSQLKAASSIIKPFEVMAPQRAGASKRQSFWVIEFDPKDLDKKRRYRPRPVFKPSLPDDLAVRINAARLALDPRRPILSLTTVLEHILQVEDPSDEIDRIWEDIANTDPVIVFEQVAAALERMGETDLAERIQEKQFRQSMIEQLQFQQQTGSQVPTPGQPPSQGAPGQMPAQAGMNPGSGAGQGNPLAGSLQQPASDVAHELATMGERGQV